MAKYVRLRDGVTAYAHLGSGFAITGLDVVEVPEELEDTIQTVIQRGRLVEASKADYDKIHENDPEVKVEAVVVPHQEARTIRAAQAQRKAALEVRDEKDDEKAAELADAVQNPDQHQDENQLQGRPAKRASKK